MESIPLTGARQGISFKGSNFKRVTPRDEKYRDWVKTLPCLECMKPAPSEAHHTETGGIGIKGSDYSCVPLCLNHHAEWHNTKGKRGGLGIDALESILSRLKACYPGIIKK